MGPIPHFYGQGSKAKSGQEYCAQGGPGVTSSWRPDKQAAKPDVKPGVCLLIPHPLWVTAAWSPQAAFSEGTGIWGQKIDRRVKTLERWT